MGIVLIRFICIYLNSEVSYTADIFKNNVP